MWRRAVLVQATLLLASAWDVTYYTRTRLYPPFPRVECYDYPASDWSSSGRFASVRPSAGKTRGTSRLANLLFDGGPYSSSSFGMQRAFSRRFDSLHLSSSKEDIAKEHAKLVQDINGLKQPPKGLVAQAAVDSGDYDDSIYPEEIDTSATETTRLVETSAHTGEKRGVSASLLSALPVVGASQDSSWLTGSPVRPRRQYTPARPGLAAPTVRVCLSPAPLLYPKPTSNLLQRLIHGILSK